MNQQFNKSIRQMLSEARGKAYSTANFAMVKAYWNIGKMIVEEVVNSQWSTRQLERQINSFFYERLLSSKNKKAVSEEIKSLEPSKTPEDIIRDPYVLGNTTIHVIGYSNYRRSSR